MLDALHNLSLRARQCRVFHFQATLHDSGHAHVMLSCHTDEDVLALAAMLRLDGLHQSQPPQVTGNELHTWLGVTFQCGLTEIRIIGPQHAAAKEAA